MVCPRTLFARVHLSWQSRESRTTPTSKPHRKASGPLLALASLLQDLLRWADLRCRGLQDRLLLGPPDRPSLPAPDVGILVGDLNALAAFKLLAERYALLLQLRHPPGTVQALLGGPGLGRLQRLELHLPVPALNLRLGLPRDLPRSRR